MVVEGIIEHSKKAFAVHQQQQMTLAKWKQKW
jgi:hypothetical protein